MTADLTRVMVCPPDHAGWKDSAKAAAWRELGFQHPPSVSAAQSQHGVLCRLLDEAGAEVLTLAVPQTENDITLDAVYAHDASLPTNYGLILMRPGKATRIPEAKAHAEFCARHAIPTLAEIEAPGTSEAGDIVWLDGRTLLVGRGYRTNRAGIEQLRDILAPHRVEVFSAPLPHNAGPSACLHLMSLMSMLDERTILVDLPWLSVETVELLQARNFRLIEIDYAERDTLACNVLSLGSGRLIALEENSSTNARLRQEGFEVQTFAGSELCVNGGGGPTCLTRPLQRGSR
ncbi:MAG: dimethylarginine dimethylaminohydrolase family protein [Terriglobales bacterium]